MKSKNTFHSAANFWPVLYRRTLSPRPSSLHPGARQRAAFIELLVVLGLSVSLSEWLPSGLAQAPFTKIIVGDIVNDGGNSFACAWGDYDGDGYLDLFVTNGENSDQQNFLYHNNGNGTFTRISTGAIATDSGLWRGCTWADFDNDGKLDLLVCNGADNVFQTVLYRNNGDGTFTYNHIGPLVPPNGGSSFAPALIDYDNDGLLDLFLGRLGFDWVFHNQTNGTFLQINNGLGLGETGSAQGNVNALWSDYNNDGRPDLFVPASDGSASRLYLNVGGGTFARVTSGDIATVTNSFSAAWGDYNNDGLPDLFVTSSLTNETNGLYRNNGNGTFTRMTASVVGSIASDPAGFDQCAWGDYDNDGFLDLYLTATPGIGGRMGGNALYHNNGDGTFTRVLTGPPVEDVADSVGCAWGDYDNDGFLDLFVANGGVVGSENNALYHNEGNSNSWLKVKCLGTVSNRSAIGAKVRVNATLHGRIFWQLREINSGNGICQSPLEAHFGLGDATNATTVRIEWPSGAVQEFHDVAAKELLAITEPPRVQPVGLLADGSFQLSLTGGLGFIYDLQRSTDLAHWELWTTVTNTSRTITVTDTNTVNAPQRFYRAASQ